MILIRLEFVISATTIFFGQNKKIIHHANAQWMIDMKRL